MSSVSVREAFHEAATHFVEAAALVASDELDDPGLGEWSVRSLVGHTSRALLTVENYLAAGSERIEIENVAQYFSLALSSSGDGAAITERGRQAGIALGEDPAGAVRTIAERVLPIVEQASDDALLGTPWGGMRLIDYLPTRVFELAVHGIDLEIALGRSHSLPASVSACVWAVLGELAHARDVEMPVLQALTGRGGLRPRFSLLASDADVGRV